ncbi:MAG: glycosyltransferase, partial [bacterium]|nr:glycosyltransferase [bacterium]
DNLEDQSPQNFISHKSVKTSLFSKYNQTKNYDFIFFLNDGSIPFLFSKKNILHVQVPFISQQNFKEKLVNQFKFNLLNKIVCNSKFTASYLPKNLNHKTEVIYPPVDIESMISTEPKQNIILSVGRFDNVLNSKKQELLIDTFSKLVLQNSSTDWKLILMGGSKQKPENNHFLMHLQNISSNLPVEFIVNPDYEKLKQVYAVSKIYWHAAGYDVDVKLHPEHCEHFGMAPVEAMASGLVPILVNKGGLPEIVKDGVDGYLWDDPSQLLAKTQLLIATPSDISSMSQQAIKTSQQFSKSIFKDKITNLLKLS